MGAEKLVVALDAAKTSSGDTANMVCGDWGCSMAGGLENCSGISRSSRLTSSSSTLSLGLRPSVCDGRKSSTDSKSSNGSSLISMSRSMDWGGHSDGELGPRGERPILLVSW